MSDEAIEAVFDGHNDVLSRLWKTPGDAVERFFAGEADGHIDAPRARRGGLAGGLCAIYVASPDKDAVGDALPVGSVEALATTVGMFGLLHRLERRSQGRLRLCRGVDDIRKAITEGAFAAVAHIEGAEAVGADLDALYLLYDLGLRSLGPVWSRPNLFAAGVPFRFPSSPDVGPGLTGAGRDLVRACNDLGIVVDLAHITERGFWDVAALSQAPLVVTHAAVHALCPHSRNLTDRQIDAVAASGGVIGINFGVKFLRADGEKNADTPIDRLIDHMDHIARRVGIGYVAFGSDFDGTTIPDAIKDAAGLPRVVAAMKVRGWNDDEIAAVCLGNWLRVLGDTWRS